MHYVSLIVHTEVNSILNYKYKTSCEGILGEYDYEYGFMYMCIYICQFCTLMDS